VYPTVEFKLIEVPYFKFDEFFSMLANYNFYMDCMSLSFLVVLESMIVSKVVDNLSNTKSKFEINLACVGLGNMLSIFTGGLPVTFSGARS
jgi:MFS superfamily sulfate permease-like transporter